MGPRVRGDDARWRSRWYFEFNFQTANSYSSLRAKRSNPWYRTKKEWIASAYALRRFGGLLPCEARAASGAGSSLSLLAMTSGYTSSIPRRACARAVLASSPQEKRGRRECRALAAPAASRANKKAHEHSRYGHTGLARHSPLNGFSVSFVLPGDRAFLPPSPARSSPRKLDISVGMPGPHDLTVRNATRSSAAPPASTASRTQRP